MSSFEVVKFKAEHIFQIDEQEITRGVTQMINPDYWRRVELKELQYTCLVDGKPAAAGGMIEYWPGRCELWAVIGKNTKSVFLKIHRTVQAFLTVVPNKRIEAKVDFDFEQGKRWMRLLGFEMEASRMKSYFPDGKDAVLYSYLREH